MRCAGHHEYSTRVKAVKAELRGDVAAIALMEQQRTRSGHSVRPFGFYVGRKAKTSGGLHRRPLVVGVEAVPAPWRSATVRAHLGQYG